MNVFIGTSVASSARAFEAATDTAADRVEATMARRPVVAAESLVAALGDVCLGENAAHGVAAIDKMTTMTEQKFIVSDGRAPACLGLSVRFIVGVRRLEPKALSRRMTQFRRSAVPYCSLVPTPNKSSCARLGAL